MRPRCRAKRSVLGHKIPETIALDADRHQFNVDRARGES